MIREFFLTLVQSAALQLGYNLRLSLHITASGSRKDDSHILITFHVSLPIILSGAKAFEISDIQDGAPLARSDCNNVTL